MKRILVLVCLMAFAVAYAIGGGARVVDKTLTAEFATYADEDTARVIYFESYSALAGFDYWDSVAYQADTSKWDTAHWTAPMQAMIFTLGVVTDTPTVVDSAAIGAVSCSVAFQAQTLGFDFDLSTCADALLATALDSLVATFNGTADLTDSVDAQDSGTYIKLVSLIAEDVLGGPWTIGMSSDSTDTAVATGMVTIAMVTDSMVAAVNGLDSAHYWTAANVGDTSYTITADDQGLTIWAAAKDTAQDTSTTQENVTSVSAITDTFSLAEFNVGLVNESFRASGVTGWIILHPCSDTNQGFGDSDSAKIWLYSIEKADSNLIYSVLDEDSCNSLPCSCRVDVIDAAANDSLFHHSMGIGYRIMDTLTDTVIDASYRMSVDLIITDGF